MASIVDTKVLRCTASYLPLGVVAIYKMVVYPLKWTLHNNMDRFKARWGVLGFLYNQCHRCIGCRRIKMHMRHPRYPICILAAPEPVATDFFVLLLPLAA